MLKLSSSGAGFPALAEIVPVLICNFLKKVEELFHRCDFRPGYRYLRTLAYLVLGLNSHTLSLQINVHHSRRPSSTSKISAPPILKNYPANHYSHASTRLDHLLSTLRHLSFRPSIYLSFSHSRISFQLPI